MKILVPGGNGQLGRDMVPRLEREGWEVRGVDLPEFDITDPDMTGSVLRQFRPDVVINCSACTAVDVCESERDRAFAVNARAVGELGRFAREVGASVVHISTDYVFDGTLDRPYLEGDTACPRSVYGQSKLEGEQRLAQALDRFYIFRTAWLYGNHGNNFAKTIRRLATQRAAEGQPLRVVDDQRGTPTYTVELCAQIIELLRRFPREYGLYHCTAEGSCSWYEFAQHIVASYAIPAQVQPCTTAEFPRPAPRPANSILENARLKRLGVNCMQEWKRAFGAYLREEARLEQERSAS